VEEDSGDEVLLPLGGAAPSSPGIPGVSPKVDIIYVYIRLLFFDRRPMLLLLLLLMLLAAAMALLSFFY
jgi:hypothetical protein